MLEDLIRQIEELPLHHIRIECPLDLSEPLWRITIQKQEDWLNHQDDIAYTSAEDDLTKALQNVLHKLNREEYTVVRRS